MKNIRAENFHQFSLVFTSYSFFFIIFFQLILKKEIAKTPKSFYFKMKFSKILRRKKQ